MFWDYCLQWHVRIYNLTARDHHKVCGTNPYTATTGEEGDISSVSQYGWYQWYYFREHINRFPHNQEVLGQVLGPACGEGNEMAQWILKANGNVYQGGPTGHFRLLRSIAPQSSTKESCSMTSSRGDGAHQLAH